MIENGAELVVDRFQINLGVGPLGRGLPVIEQPVLPLECRALGGKAAFRDIPDLSGPVLVQQACFDPGIMRLGLVVGFDFFVRAALDCSKGRSIQTW